jgi:hypothetical protein
MRQWTPIKFKKISMKMGRVQKARTLFLDWAYLTKKYNLHKQEIYRKRGSQARLRIAIQRISKLKVYQ